MRGVNTRLSFERTIDAARRMERTPGLVLATGDLAQDESRGAYRRFRDTLADWDTPVLSIPGNHDDPGLLRQELGHGHFQACGIFETAHWRLIGLDTAVHGQTSGRIDPAELASLEQTLAADTSRFVLIALHHQPLPMGSRWLDTVGLEDAEAFRELVVRHPHVRAVVWGHVHQASDRTLGQARLLSTPSTCAQFLPASEHFALDDRPPGFRWIDLGADGSIDTELVWVEGTSAE